MSTKFGEKSLPTISIVTPSFNQAEFLEDCIRSVIDQSYPRLEYVIIDGGSTDGSVDIIRRHEGRLKHWVSEPDKGQYDAVNKGFAQSTGEIMAYLNSDDKYTPWAFQVIGEIFSAFPTIEWLTAAYPLTWDEDGRAVACSFSPGFSRRAFYKGANLPGMGWHHHSFVQQESTFWRRSLWERSGGYINSSLKLAADFELWSRFYQHGELYSVDTSLAGFRVHKDQKTASHLEEYLNEAYTVLRACGGRPYGTLQTILRRRFALLRPMPAGSPILSLLSAMGLVYPSKVVAHGGREGGWRVSTTYMV